MWIQFSQPQVTLQTLEPLSMSSETEFSNSLQLTKILFLALLKLK